MLFCNIILAYWYIYFSFAKFYVLFKVNKFEVIQYMLEEDILFSWVLVLSFKQCFSPTCHAIYINKKVLNLREQK